MTCWGCGEMREGRRSDQMTVRTTVCAVNDAGEGTLLVEQNGRKMAFLYWKVQPGLEE